MNMPTDHKKERDTLVESLRISAAEAEGIVAGLEYSDLQRIRACREVPAERRPKLLAGYLPTHLIAAPGPPSAPRRVILRGTAEGEHRTGPFHGQAALQRALRAAQAQGRFEWLAIGGPAEPDDFVWFWAWLHVAELIARDLQHRPYAVGPNVLFQFASAPKIAAGEKRICNSPYCRLIFTESAWYEQLIRHNLGPQNTAPIVTWPYPIDPVPEGPIDPAHNDLLIYNKQGGKHLLNGLRERFSRRIELKYGKHTRAELFDAARKSRACVYVSRDDRGPLGLAEILLAGCPAVGVARGAPWLEIGRTGLHVPALDATHLGDITEAVEDLFEWDRQKVRAEALKMFDTANTLDTIERALDQARRQ